MNFYNKIYSAIPRKQRPNIRRMEYASPGEMVLIAALPTCFAIVLLLRQIVKLGHETVSLYRSIYKELSRRKLTKLEAKGDSVSLSTEDHHFCMWAFTTLAGHLGLTDEQKIVILKSSKNPLAALKILASLYRRGRDLAEFEAKRKTNMLRNE